MKIHVASIAKITLAFVIIIMVVEPRIKKWVREQQKIKKIEITPGIYTKIYDNFKAEVCQHLTKQRLYLEIAYTKTRIQNNLNADEPIWNHCYLRYRTYHCSNPQLVQKMKTM